MRVLAMAVLLLSILSGCVSYKPGVFPVGRLSNGMNAYVDNGLEVYINTPAFPTKNIFSCDLESNGIIPAYISITNNGSHHYTYSKKDINNEYLPAKQVAKKCAFNVFEHGGIFPPTIAIVESVNNDIKDDYASKEIPEEAKIPPGKKISGLIFLKKDMAVNRFDMFFDDITTGAKINLGVDAKNSLTKSNFGVIVGEKYFTQTNLHLSNGNTIYPDNSLDGKILPLGTEVTIMSADDNAISFKTDDGKAYVFKRDTQRNESILFEKAPDLFFGKKNPLTSAYYSSLTDSEKLQIKIGKPEEGMSKDLIVYTLGHTGSQKSPYFDNIKWSYRISGFQPLYIFFDIDNKVFKIHEGDLVQNQEYAILIERQLRTYIGAHKSSVVINEGPPERTMPDGSGGEILIYDNYVPVKVAGTVINNEQFYSHYSGTTWGVSTTTVNSGYKESMRVSFYTDQNGLIYLVRCNITRQEGGPVKYEKN